MTANGSTPLCEQSKWCKIIGWVCKAGEHKPTCPELLHFCSSCRLETSAGTRKKRKRTKQTSMLYIPTVLLSLYWFVLKGSYCWTAPLSEMPMRIDRRFIAFYRS